MGDGTVGVSAFRYGAGTRPIPSPAVRDVGAFARLRDSMRVGDAEPWTVCIVKVERSTARVAVNFVDAEYAGLWHVAPETYDRVAEALRPQAADFFTATLDRNESGPPSVVEPVLVVEVHADGGLRLTTPEGSGPATLATLRGALLDAATRGTGVVVNGDVDAPLAQPIVAEARRTVPTVEVVPTDPQPWPHRWSSVQLTAAGGLTAELQDLLTRGAAAGPRRGSTPYRLAMRHGHVPALVALRTAHAPMPAGSAPPTSLPAAVVLRTYLPSWTRWVVIASALLGLAGLIATRQWAFLVVAATGAALVGAGNAVVGRARVAIDGPRLAVRPFARWHGPIDVRELAALDYRPALSTRMAARWRMVDGAGRSLDVVVGHDFMTPGFERHLASWVTPARTTISASASERLAAFAGQPD